MNHHPTCDHNPCNLLAEVRFERDLGPDIYACAVHLLDLTRWVCGNSDGNVYVSSIEPGARP